MGIEEVKDHKGLAVSARKDVHPFTDAEEVWFWFITAQEARNDGARFTSGLGVYNRPCEPIDILKILDRLYRQRRLQRDHLLVLRHYGRRHMAPDARRVKERRAYGLWKEAFERMSPLLEKKGIIEPQSIESVSWVKEALLFETVE